MNILKTTIEAGIKRPLRLLHITDSHITLSDFDGENERGKYFSRDYENSHIDYFIQASEYAKKNNLIILHTGDLTDFVSDKNCLLLNECFSGTDFIYAVGNHDFCKFENENEESYTLKKERFKATPPYNGNLVFSSRIINGVNFVTLDNSSFKISCKQTEMLKKEAEKGLPIILAMHVPIFSEKHADAVLETGLPCAQLCCPSEKYLSKYPENAKIQQAPDSETVKAVEYIKNEPIIKAIISGHTHINNDENIGKYCRQITTGACYNGYIREITIK